MEGLIFGRSGHWAKEKEFPAQNVIDPKTPLSKGQKKVSTSTSWMVWGQLYSRLGQLQSKSILSLTYGRGLWYLFDPDL